MLSDRHGFSLMVAFGSVLREDSEPRDLDLAVRFLAPIPSVDADDRRRPDLLDLLDDLYRVTGSQDVDLMVLNDASPVPRERALVGGRPLFQRGPGEFANAQIAAIMERMDTDHLRRLDLELMSG